MYIIYKVSSGYCSVKNKKKSSCWVCRSSTVDSEGQPCLFEDTTDCHGQCRRRGRETTSLEGQTWTETCQPDAEIHKLQLLFTVFTVVFISPSRNKQILSVSHSYLDDSVCVCAHRCSSSVFKLLPSYFLTCDRWDSVSHEQWRRSCFISEEPRHQSGLDRYF